MPKEHPYARIAALYRVKFRDSEESKKAFRTKSRVKKRPAAYPLIQQSFAVEMGRGCCCWGMAMEFDKDRERE